jgi:hypothetical protein
MLVAAISRSLHYRLDVILRHGFCFDHAHPWAYSERTLAARDSMLGLWTTNYHMLNGSRRSRRLRIPAHYDCILATRGKPTVTLNKQTTLLEGPVRGHSVKPVEFYELVETALSGTALRLFVLAVPAQSEMGLPWR